MGSTAYGGAGNDLIIGSQAGDHLAGGSGDDTILGQGGSDHIYGDSGVNVNILTRALHIPTVDASPAPTVDPRLGASDQTFKPVKVPTPMRDDMVAGNDFLDGNGSGNPDLPNIIFGDHGVVVQWVDDPNLPPILLQKIQTTELSTVIAINSAELQNGGDDVLYGDDIPDVLIGGPGNDMLDGREDDDLIFGDSVYLTRRGGDDGNLLDDIQNPRFQTLAGTLMYSRTDRPVPAGVDPAYAYDASGPNSLNEYTSGRLLTDGVARNYRDPTGPQWWAEYLIDYADLHTFSINNGQSGVGSFGNDYIAGGAGNDMIFGQLGHDVIQGDGSIDDAVAAIAHVGAARKPSRLDDPNGPGIDDPVGPLFVVASFEAASDGEDYIEGGGGKDVIFGGLGQDDLVGGSSAFFSLVNPDNRPDDKDWIFGGAGTQIDRNNGFDPLANTNGSAETFGEDVVMIADGTPFQSKHARDSDAIAGDNADIIRIVGVNHIDVNANPETNPFGQNYVTFNYDNYGGEKIVVRGIRLLDYTPGGPDFKPEDFSLVDPATTPDPSDDDMRPMFSLCCDPTRGIWARYDIGGNDEVHGETGDDFIYLGGGFDIAFGDADDDDIIGGWGHDWISGGTGSDGILGDDGRIFTSRNTSNPLLAERLYGIEPLLDRDPDTRTSQGNVLNELISTPGQVQVELINIAGELKKSVDLTPFNLTPRELGAADPTLSNQWFADDILFGGLGKDFIHGGSGDDAISGAEAVTESYAPRFDQNGNFVGLIRTDFSRPYNPGDILKFGDGDPHWNEPKPVQSRTGEFFLYDEYDPRRVILFEDDAGTVWKGPVDPDGTLPDGLFQYFLNAVSDEGVSVLGYVAFAPNGQTPIGDPEYRQSDGDDVLFGDLGNDWIVGGTGRDHIYGGFGNDLLNADDVLGTVNPDPPQNSPGQLPLGGTDETPDTHLVYEDRVFGGAGLDILIGNTKGDRLIDWVGEFNSYIVPFAPFGIATVSRQVPPHLMDFLFAQAFSDGVDITRTSDTGQRNHNDRYSNVARLQGEIHGEMGLVTQQDHGYWQDQTGGPTDPQAGNVPGGRRDVLRSADFNDGQAQGFFIDSGDWQVVQGRYQVSPNSIGDVLNIQQHRFNTGNAVVYRHGPGGSAIGGLVDGQTYYVIRLDNHRLKLAATLADAQAGQAIHPTSKGTGTAHTLTGGNRTLTFDPGPALEVQGDAVAVMYVGHWLPTYFEIKATLNAGKPTGGLTSNAYFIFDYQSPEDFKFAGINISNNKLEMGYRDATGWQIVASANSQLSADKDYDVLVAINGTVVTLVLLNSSGGPGQGNNVSFTYTFAPRVDADGNNYGINHGLVGLAANNSVSRLNDVVVQVLPPEITYDHTHDFSSQTGGFEELSGSWQIVNGRYEVTSPGGGGVALSTTALEIGMDSLLQLETRLRTDAIGGVVFDVYGPDDFKFAALSPTTNQVLVGYHTARHGWQVVAAAPRTLNTATDYTLGLVLKGTTVSVTVDGQAALGHSFNGLVVDGDFGMLSRGGAGSFDSFTVKTNDPRYKALEVSAALSAIEVQTGAESLTETMPAEDQAEDVPIFARQNPHNQYDVNDDGVVTPFDVLLVINHLNANGSAPVPASLAAPPTYLDVSGDNLISPFDALLVLNHLNASTGAAGEGELEARLSPLGVTGDGTVAASGSRRWHAPQLAGVLSAGPSGRQSCLFRC